jgi:hypothetical protein
MLTRVVTSLPLGSLDVWFARGLGWLGPRVAGRACEVCSGTYSCGTCGCSQGPTCGDLRCDGCGTGVCYCYCPPPPLC